MSCITELGAAFVPLKRYRNMFFGSHASFRAASSSAVPVHEYCGNRLTQGAGRHLASTGGPPRTLARHRQGDILLLSDVLADSSEQPLVPPAFASRMPAVVCCLDFGHEHWDRGVDGH